MKAWRLTAPGAAPTLDDIARPEVRAGAVLVRMQAAPMLSYLRDYCAGRLPYRYPPGPFTLGTNGVGVVEAVGEGVYHLVAGQRAVLSPFLTADEGTDAPARILMGLTGMTEDSGPMLDTWRDGTLSQYVLAPASTLTALVGLDALDAERLATLGKFIVPLGGLLRGRLAVEETLIVNGATGYFGSAGVLLGVALGASRVIAAGAMRRSCRSLPPLAARA